MVDTPSLRDWMVRKRNDDATEDVGVLGRKFEGLHRPPPHHHLYGAAGAFCRHILLDIRFCGASLRTLSRPVSPTAACVDCRTPKQSRA